ncbi:MAG: hypothetical protein GXY83_32755 [Rhodopirellula sp.]|nr:hypothetical protein [Rhodopirellula sp.]
MGGSIVGLAVLLTGINVGWEKLPDGGYVYIIQIEPESLDAMRAGLPIESHLEPRFRGIRSYRIVVGKGELPREGTPDLPEAAPAPNRFPIAQPGEASPLSASVESPSRAEQTGFFPDAEEGETSDKTKSKAQEDPKSWQLLMIMLALLLGSVSGNLYLGWITWDTRGRYRRLLRRVSGQPRETPAYSGLSESAEEIDGA